MHRIIQEDTTPTKHFEKVARPVAVDSEERQCSPICGVLFDQSEGVRIVELS